ITTDQGTCTSAVAPSSDFTFARGNVCSRDTYSVRVTSSAPANATPGARTNSATASSTTSDPVSANDTGSDTTTVQTSADLRVLKSDGLTTVTAGDGLTHTYTITVKNLGSSVAQPLTPAATLFPYTTLFRSITTDQGTCTSAVAPSSDF